MKPVDSIRAKLIDKILAIQNTDFLKALNNLVSSPHMLTKSLSNEQLEMLLMSENDIENGDHISHIELRKVAF